MRISILIILYNTSIADCTTLAGILHADKSTVDDLSITIWNNGQHTLPSHEIDRLNHLFGKNKISGTLYNTDNNYSLSKIYNFFLAQGDPTHYILFDDDTTIPSDFFTNLTELPYHDVVVPRVFETQSKAFVAPSTKQVHGDSKVVMKLGSYTGTPLYFINSGLCLSKEFVASFHQANGFIFNEAFALDEVDTCFCHNLQAATLKTPYTIAIQNTIEHTISIHAVGEHTISDARNRELMYGRCLIRLFTNKKSRRSALSFVLRKNRHLLKTANDMLAISRCILYKRHPRITKALNQAFSKDIQNPICIHCNQPPAAMLTTNQPPTAPSSK